MLFDYGEQYIEMRPWSSQEMKPPMDETVETAPPSLEPHLADLAPSLAPELLAPEVCGQVSAAQVVPALVEGRVREGSESGDWPRDRSGRPAPHFDAKREPAGRPPLSPVQPA